MRVPWIAAMALLLLAGLWTASAVADGHEEVPGDPFNASYDDPFAEEEELFENASDPFFTYEQAASQTENTTLVHPDPLAEEADGDDGGQAPPADGETEETDRSTPGPGVLGSLIGLSAALMMRSRP